MGLDQYFHRFRSLKEEDVNRLKGKVSYETYQELSNKLSFIDADEVNESNDLQITEYYGVLTDVELLIIDYEAAFSEKYPDVKYEDCVCVGAHYGPQGSGRTYRNKVTDERYSGYVKYIDTPYISDIAVHQDATNPSFSEAIKGGPTERTSDTEGKVSFDVFFSLAIPKKRKSSRWGLR